MPSRARTPAAPRASPRASASAASARPAPPAPRPAPAPAAAPPALASDVWHGAFAGPADRFLRTTLGPLLLLLATPLFVNLAALAALRHGSSFTALAAAYATPRAALAAAFPLPSARLAAALAAFVAFEAALLVALPGRVFAGAVAPSGFVPHFRANGGAAYLCTAAAAAALVASGRLPATALYDNALELLTLLNGAALALAGALAVKGVVAPSTRDAGTEGGLLFSLFWGAELYPSVRGLQLKQLFISRCGMMSWGLATASFAAAAVRAHGGVTPPLAASATLNALYVAKFFLCFEADYLRAADIAVDRFGFMLCWGPLVFMPLAHNLQTLHLVTHAGLPLSWAGAAAWVALGTVAIAVNLSADTQRHAVRAAGGRCSVWGRPATFIRAPYSDASGRRHENLLLTCGWHAHVRHFHYAPDILLLVLYCAPAGLNPLAWTYFFYLTALLLDRTGRIDARCAAKYGAAWAAYERAVPYKLVPGVW
jgi:7-dehydrocholesterol reductase